MLYQDRRRGQGDHERGAKSFRRRMQNPADEVALPSRCGIGHHAAIPEAPDDQRDTRPKRQLGTDIEEGRWIHQENPGSHPCQSDGRSHASQAQTTHSEQAEEQNRAFHGDPGTRDPGIEHRSATGRAEGPIKELSSTHAASEAGTRTQEEPTRQACNQPHMQSRDRQEVGEPETTKRLAGLALEAAAIPEHERADQGPRATLFLESCAHAPTPSRPCKADPIRHSPRTPRILGQGQNPIGLHEASPRGLPTPRRMMFPICSTRVA